MYHNGMYIAIYRSLWQSYLHSGGFQVTATKLFAKSYSNQKRLIKSINYISELK